MSDWPTWLLILLPFIFLIGVFINAIDALKAQDKWVSQYKKKKTQTPPNADDHTKPDEHDSDDWGW